MLKPANIMLLSKKSYSIVVFSEVHPILLFKAYINTWKFKSNSPYTRDALWTQSTSRGRHRSMLPLRGAAWRFAGLCCREQGAGCSMRGTTAASHHWTSADREKHLGESSLSIILFKTLSGREVCRIIPLVSCR